MFAIKHKKNLPNIKTHKNKLLNIKENLKTEIKYISWNVGIAGGLISSSIFTIE